jgi:hypothetical protein
MQNIWTKLQIIQCYNVYNFGQVAQVQTLIIVRVNVGQRAGSEAFS